MNAASVAEYRFSNSSRAAGTGEDSAGDIVSRLGEIINGAGTSSFKDNQGNVITSSKFHKAKELHQRTYPYRFHVPAAHRYDFLQMPGTECIEAYTVENFVKGAFEFFHKNGGVGEPQFTRQMWYHNWIKTGSTSIAINCLFMYVVRRFSYVRERIHLLHFATYDSTECKAGVLSTVDHVVHAVDNYGRFLGALWHPDLGRAVQTMATQLRDTPHAYKVTADYLESSFWEFLWQWLQACNTPNAPFAFPGTTVWTLPSAVGLNPATNRYDNTAASWGEIWVRYFPGWLELDVSMSGSVYHAWAATTAAPLSPLLLAASPLSTSSDDAPTGKSKRALLREKKLNRAVVAAPTPGPQKHQAGPKPVGEVVHLPAPTCTNTGVWQGDLGRLPV
jgi:hypothetical protein